MFKIEIYIFNYKHIQAHTYNSSTSYSRFFGRILFINQNEADAFPK